MSEPIDWPEIPPSGPWAAYVLIIIWLPLVFRLFLLFVPFRKAVLQLAPHAGWAIKKVKHLPIKGFGVLAINEILAFMVPPLIVLSLRLFSDPIGWKEWSEVSNIGLLMLIFFTILWIFIDIIRIGKIRKMLNAIEKQDLDKMKIIAETGLNTRTWLRKFARKGDKKKEANLDNVAKNSVGTIGYRIWKTRRLTPMGLLGSIAFGATVEMARVGAGKLSDAVDNKLQKEFDNLAKINTKSLITLFMRDLAMGVIPIVILWILPKLV